jgi:hypothetical protein
VFNLFKTFRNAMSLSSTGLKNALLLRNNSRLRKIFLGKFTQRFGWTSFWTFIGLETTAVFILSAIVAFGLPLMIGFLSSVAVSACDYLLNLFSQDSTTIRAVLLGLASTLRVVEEATTPEYSHT